MKPKRFRCKTCGKEYCFMGWCLRHSKFKGHYKFKEILARKLEIKDVPKIQI